MPNQAKQRTTPTPNAKTKAKPPGAKRRSVAMLTPTVAAEVHRVRDLCDCDPKDVHLSSVAQYMWLSDVARRSEIAHGKVRDLIVRDHDRGREVMEQGYQLAVLAGINGAANVGKIIMGLDIDITAEPCTVDINSYLLAVPALAQLLDR